jgi:hypothetical protein
MLKKQNYAPLLRNSFSHKTTTTTTTTVSVSNPDEMFPGVAAATTAAAAAKPTVHSTRKRTLHVPLPLSDNFWRDQFIAQLTKHLKHASTAVDLRCTIVKSIYKWLLTDPTTQLGWLQAISKVTYHISGA